MSDQQITGTDLDFPPLGEESAEVKGGGFDQIMRERFALQDYPNLEEVEATRDGFIIHDFLTEDAEIIDEDEEPIIDYSGKTQRELSILYRGSASPYWEGEDKWWRVTPAEQDILIDGMWRSITNFFGENSPDAETVANMVWELLPHMPSVPVRDMFAVGMIKSAAEIVFAADSALGINRISTAQKDAFNSWVDDQTGKIKDMTLLVPFSEQIHGKWVPSPELVDPMIFMSQVSVAALPVFKGLQLLGLGPRLASVISETIALGVAVNPDMKLIGDLAKDAAKNEGFFQPMFEVLSILAINPDDPEIIKRAKHGAEGLLGALGGVAIIEAIIRSPQAKRGLVEWFKNRGGGGDGGVGEPGKMDFPPLSLNPDKTKTGSSVIPKSEDTVSVKVSEDVVFESVSGPIHMKLVSETNRALLNKLNALSVKEVLKEYKKMFPARRFSKPSWDSEHAYKSGRAKEAMIKEMVEHKAPSSYSALENAVVGAKQEKAAANDWLGLITKSGKKGDDIVKTGEIEWTGLDDWLKGHGNKTLTQAEVLQYVRENTIVLREIESHTLHAPGKSKPDDLPPPHEVDELGNAVPSPRERWAGELDARKGSFAPEHSYAKVTGEFENYREFLLIYPQGRNMGRGNYPLTAAERREWTALNSIRTNPNVETTIGGYNRLAQLDDKYLTGREGFDSPHWDAKNITSWIRVTERTVAGKRVMMIEEIQSDWAKLSPKTLPNRRGWVAQAFRQMAVKAANEGFESISWTTGATQARLNNERVFIGRISFNENVVDSSSTAIRARLNLDDPSGGSALVVDIEAPRAKIDGEPVVVRGPDQSIETARKADLVKTHIGKWTFRKNEGTPAQRRADPEKLYEIEKNASSWQGKTVEQVIGKEAANRLDVSYRTRHSNRKSEYPLLNLPDGTAVSKYDGWLGGEGKQVIYDQMMVKAAKKLAEKFGTTVSKTNLDTGQLTVTFDNVSDTRAYLQSAWDKVKNTDPDMAEKLTEAIIKLGLPRSGSRPRHVLRGLTAKEILEHLPHTIKSGGVEKVWTLNLNQKMRQSLMKKGAPVWAIGAGTMIGGAEDKQDGR